LLDKKSASALEEINHQRNNLAHGRQSLSLAKIKKLVAQGLQLDSWERISETNGELRVLDWRPWVRTSPTQTGQIGLFERWQKNALRYLVPETGEVFKAPRLKTSLKQIVTPNVQGRPNAPSSNCVF